MCEALAIHLRRWLEFRGTHPGEFIELQVLDAPASRGPRSRFAHASSTAAIVSLLEEAENWKVPGVGCDPEKGPLENRLTV